MRPTTRTTIPIQGPSTPFLVPQVVLVLCLLSNCTIIAVLQDFQVVMIVEPVTHHVHCLPAAGVGWGHGTN
ncbi:hypothetical protein EDD15DRAFT_2291469 [Pisolithus albus]|nr:hypothetical protein EDD15DRAFT_2291469 [Pisolithus albus]